MTVDTRAGWTEPRVELLKKLWPEGLSASQIAGRLGGCSRNAVTGKVHRLGLAKRGNSHKNRASGRRGALASRPRFIRKSCVMTVPLHVMRPAPVVEKPKAEPQISTSPCSFDDLKPHSCRFPLGDPRDENFRFCGLVKRAGSSYCRDHHRVAYQPLPGRRPAKEIP